jgi:hypothetical protein
MYGVEIATNSMIYYSYIPRFIKIDSGVQKLVGAYTYRDTQTAMSSHDPQ